MGARKIIPRETIVEQTKCGGCGHTVGILTNKNGNCYYFCFGSDGDGGPCSHHERWGKSLSRKMVAKFTGAIDHDETTAANDNRPPRSEPASPPSPGKTGGGFFGGAFGNDD